MGQVWQEEKTDERNAFVRLLFFVFCADGYLFDEIKGPKTFAPKDVDGSVGQIMDSLNRE